MHIICKKCHNTLSSLEIYGSEEYPLCYRCWSKTEKECKQNQLVENETHNIPGNPKIDENKDKEDPLVTVATYLEQSEAQWIANTIRAKGLKAVVNRHGIRSKYETYFRVDAEVDDVEEMKHFITSFFNQMKKNKKERYVEQLKCPRCKSREFVKVEKNTFLEKIINFGCDLYMCEKCGKRWGA